MKFTMGIIMLGVMLMGSAWGSNTDVPPQSPPRWSYNPYAQIQSFQETVALAPPTSATLPPPIQTVVTPWDQIVTQLNSQDHNNLAENILALKAGDVQQVQFDQCKGAWLDPCRFGYLPLPLGVALDSQFVDSYYPSIHTLEELAGRESPINPPEKIYFYKILIRFSEVVLNNVNHRKLQKQLQRKIHDSYFEYRLGLANILGIVAASVPRKDSGSYNRQAFDIAHEALEIALQYGENYKAGTCYLMMSKAYSFFSKEDALMYKNIMDDCISRMPPNCFYGGLVLKKFVRQKDQTHIFHQPHPS